MISFLHCVSWNLLHYILFWKVSSSISKSHPSVVKHDGLADECKVRETSAKIQSPASKPPNSMKPRSAQISLQCALLQQFVVVWFPLFSNIWLCILHYVYSICFYWSCQSFETLILRTRKLLPSSAMLLKEFNSLEIDAENAKVWHCCLYYCNYYNLWSFNYKFHSSFKLGFCRP